LIPRRRIDPSEAAGRSGTLSELEAGLQWRAVSFPHIAAPTTGDHVLPGVVAAFRTRKDMIDRFGRPAAILAAIAIAAKDRTTRHGDRAAVGNVHISQKAHDRGNIETGFCGCPHLFAASNHDRLLTKDEYYPPPCADNGKRLIACVQYEYS
jgi:hypothetical protein